MRRPWWFRGRFALWLALAVAIATPVSTYLLTASAAAAKPALDMTVGLSPASIVADGTSTSVATATVSLQGIPVPGLPVTFSSSDSGIRIGATSDNFDGTYTATVTSSTVAGTATITATIQVKHLAASASATLTQTPGPARQMTLSLQPPSILAGGRSYTTATATVADAHGNPIPADPVVFTSSDRHQKILPVTDNGNGTYSTLIKSTSKPGEFVIQATDNAARVSARSVLTEIAAANIVSPVTLQWTFHYTLTDTRFLSLVVNGAPAGTTVLIQCHGVDCPFTTHRSTVRRARRCSLHRCPTHGVLNLARDFDGRSMPPGTQVTVAITRPTGTGKYYTIDVRAGRPPRVVIACLAPGELRPRGAC